MPPTDAPPELTRAIDPATLARFAADLSALCDPARDRVLVAVSGGPDSLALLLLTHALLGDRCVAATVDHGLRPEAADEAAWVADLCAARGIDHAVLSGPLPERAGHTANLSARARALRYELLQAHADAVGATHIATAHHADDQVETLIMRLNRGAGVGGLAGVRASGQRMGGRVIRPLLGWRRTELGAIVAAAGIVAVEDPSNVSDRFDRARLRKQLAAIDWIDPLRVAASAAALADAEDAIAWMVRQLGTDRIAADGDSLTLDPSGLPFELVRRLVEQCVRQMDASAEIRGSALVRMVKALESGDTAMLGDVTAVALSPAAWRFRKAPPRRLL
ncbi:tRNA lysidine(34) synthetase TilS [Sphingomonas sp.]|uniref:tRNA lysidine(34) synthetase TilS n=1 Tax=Sphingomonas sp. TaxID=28214 RepID=UPI0025EEF3E4|nr:tRNA lysidine(34) synthetase TilS [Sphingomonas sp.]